MLKKLWLPRSGTTSSASLACAMGAPARARSRVRAQRPRARRQTDRCMSRSSRIGFTVARVPGPAAAAVRRLDQRWWRGWNAAWGTRGPRAVGPGPDVGPRLPGGIPSVLGEDACARAGALPPARPMSWLMPASAGEMIRAGGRVWRSGLLLLRHDLHHLELLAVRPRPVHHQLEAAGVHPRELRAHRHLLAAHRVEGVAAVLADARGVAAAGRVPHAGAHVVV